MIVCFAGVISLAMSKLKKETVAIDDTAIASSASEPMVATEDKFTSEERLAGIILAFVLAWMYASCAVLNRTLKDIHFTVIMFFHAIFGMLLSLAIIFGGILLTGEKFQVYTQRQYGIMVLASLFDLIAVNS